VGISFLSQPSGRFSSVIPFAGLHADMLAGADCRGAPVSALHYGP
jgi:hypothetical protein